MSVENKLGMNFDSLAKRILYSYLATYPRFILIDDEVASNESQKQMHDFLREALYSIYENPSIIGIEKEPDAYYENWQMDNSNPPLMKAMEKIEKKFFGFLENLLKAGRLGEINGNELIISKKDWSINKATVEMFQKVGIECIITKEQSKLFLSVYPEIFPTLKMFSYKDDINGNKNERMIIFLHGRYSDKNYNINDFFGELCGNQDELQELEIFFISKGFQLNNIRHGAKSRGAYVKWLKEYSNDEKGFLSVFFDWRKKNQMVFEFRVPQFRVMLNSYNKMGEHLKQLIISRTKTCDNCGYCTQLDKTGKRQKLALDLSLNDESFNKCPLYPNLNWNYIDKEELKTIKQLFEFAESIL